MAEQAISSETSFHDSTLLSLTQKGAEVSIAMDGVYLEEKPQSANVVVRKIAHITRNGIPASTISMEDEDGEVLRLHCEKDHVLFVVEWSNFHNKQREIAVYQLFGGQIFLQEPTKRT